MKINDKAICCRKKFKDTESSAMFLVSKEDFDLIGTIIKVGSFNRKVIKFHTEGNKKYIVCSMIIMNKFK